MRNLHKIQNVLKLSANQRFEYYIRKVTDFELVWGLYVCGWAMTSDDEGRKAIPFWPEEEFARLCAKDLWANYEPKAIALSDFLSKWLPGMQNDGALVAVFPTPENGGVLVKPGDLQECLFKEAEQYE